MANAQSRNMAGGLYMRTIYTDGACLSGRGGWAWARVSAEGQLEATGEGEHVETTNNRMELQAAIAGLEASDRQPVRVISDSKYVIDGASSWLKHWKLKGWKTKGNKPVKNRDLWERIDALQSARLIEWRWVKGHDGHRWNEDCDRRANARAGIVAGAHDAPFWAKPRLVKRQ